MNFRLKEFEKDLEQFNDFTKKVEPKYESLHINENILFVYYSIKLNKYSDALGKQTYALVLLTSVLVALTIVLAVRA